MLVVVAGALPLMRSAGRRLLVYLGLAVTVFVLIASKVGSDLNYQIESTILLILCVALSLHALDFFRVSFDGARTWITLLQLPLAVFLVVNYGITTRDVIVRVVTEQVVRGEIEDLRSLLAGGGPVLSADYNAMARLRGRIDVEMLIYNWLVEARVVNPEPVTRDIANGKFSTILLMEDVNHRDPNLNVELSTLPKAQIDEVRRHYRLVKQNSIGIYIYKPIGRQ